jgi:nucleotide-binding universal stress UspA family protein
MHAAQCENTINTMREILVATDGSPAAWAALEQALVLAAETGSGIAVITVWRALQGDFGLAYPSTAVLPDILEAERTHAEASLETAFTRAEEAGVAIVTRLATGDPAEVICSYAEEIQARLIAIGTRGHGTVATLILGSVSQAVVRNAPCPVLVVRDPARAWEGTTPEARRPVSSEATG